jgi:hypothetical protein
VCLEGNFMNRMLGKVLRALVVLGILPSQTTGAADAELCKLKSQSNNVTAQQRQMAKVANYNVNSFCISILTFSNQQLTQHQYVTGSNL